MNYDEYTDRYSSFGLENKNVKNGGEGATKKDYIATNSIKQKHKKTRRK